MNPLIQFRTTALLPLIALVLVCFGLAPKAQAVSPPPDGGYPGGNTAEGDNALMSLTNGAGNTAIGLNALFSNTTGNGNTANGVSALFSNTTGNGNTANGNSALFGNTTASNNTATGDRALSTNSTGFDNTATGTNALFSNTMGNNNTATGFKALVNNTTGGANTASGLQALDSNTTGGNNTANGENALFFNTTGFNNTAEGFQALLNTMGSSNIGVGSNAGINLTTGSNNIDIGNGGAAGEAAKIRIGTGGTQTATFIAGIHGVAVTGPTVVVNSSGQLGVAPSSARFKEAIKPMDKASEAILALKPVTFHYKQDLDPAGIKQFGLVAEEVEKIDPKLVVCDKEGKPYTVRYDAVNAMLLNEFLKEHKKTEELEATVASLIATVKEQAAQIRKVSAQLELNKPALQTVDK